jgi:hypothetical protein
MPDVTIVLERIVCQDTTEAGHDEVYYLKPTVDRSKGGVTRSDTSFDVGPGLGQGANAGGPGGDNTAWDCNDSGDLADLRLDARLFTLNLEPGERVFVGLNFRESDGDDLRKAELIAASVAGTALALVTLAFPPLAGLTARIGAAILGVTGMFQGIGGIPNEDDVLGFVGLTLDADGSTVRFRQVGTSPGRVVEVSKNGTPARVVLYLNDSGSSYYLTFRMDGAVTARPSGSVVESPLTTDLTAKDFTHWATAGGEIATGRLNDMDVTLSGPLGSAFYLHDDYPNFNQSQFTPQLPATGMVEIVGAVGHAFHVDLSEPLEDPVLLLGSLASVMTFPPGTVINKVSGDPGLSVRDNTVVGLGAAAHGPLATTDSNGSVRLAGVFSRLSFTLEPAPDPAMPLSDVHDGVFLQVGGTVPI